MMVRQVSVVKPRFEKVMGKSVPDYLETRAAPAPRLVPLEVVFRFGFPPGSSILERVGRDPSYLEKIGFGGVSVSPGASIDFPVLEMFTKLEPSDRPVGLVEALAISGVSGQQLQELLLKTAWVAGWLRAICARAGLELADGKLEWAVTETGEMMLVDAIGPDEMRLLSKGVQVSKEFLRAFYRPTTWYGAVSEAKSRAAREGSAEWKRFVSEPPPALPANYREAAQHLYPALANALAGRKFFPQAWAMEQLVGRLGELGASS
jgi:phosphoribosylaminoimidazole-succinocarboxamide synthase